MVARLGGNGAASAPHPRCVTSARRDRNGGMANDVRRVGPHRSASGARPAGGTVSAGASRHRSSGDSCGSRPVAMIRSARSSPLSTKSSACNPIVARWCRLLQSNTPFAPHVFRTPIPADTARSCSPGTAWCLTMPGPASSTRAEAARTCVDRFVGRFQPQCRQMLRVGGPSPRLADLGPGRGEAPTSPEDDKAGAAASSASGESTSMMFRGPGSSPGNQKRPSPRWAAARTPWTR